jgi:diacylglycerol kinase (ATP)
MIPYNHGEMGFLRSRAASFGYAFRGIDTIVRTQRNAQIHLAATVLVLALGAVANLSPPEWCLISFSIAGVWVAEALNTAIEFLADAAVPDHHPLVGKAKDVAAGGVLVAALNAVVVGTVVFGDRLIG